MFKRILILGSAALALAAGTALADTPVVKGPFFGTVHAVGSITYKDGSQQTWNWDRGKISALDSGSITLTRRDKAQVTFAITDKTVVRNDGASYGLSDLKVGQAATVISQNGNAVLIRNIRGEGAPSGADQSAIEGPGYQSVTGTIDAQYVDGSHQSFEYDRGLITDAGDGQLTVKRADGQSVSFTYDDTTLVRKCMGERATTDELVRGTGGTFFSQSGRLVLVRCLVHPKRPAPAARPDRPAHPDRPNRPARPASVPSPAAPAVAAANA